MNKIIEGHLSAIGIRFAIIVGRFNAFISDRLAQGAVDILCRHGANPDDIFVAKVPGSFEIPLAAKRLAETGRFDAIICVGAVIKGGTPHFDFVAGAVSSGLSRVMLETNTPITFGILTTNTIDQAIERAGTKMGNKGEEAALAAIEMVHLLRNIEEQ